MVVVIVIAVLAGFAAPQLGERRAGAELAAAARRVAQAAQLGRQEAARTGRDVRLVVGRADEAAWTLETDDPDAVDEMGMGEPVAVRRGSLGGGTLPGGVAFAGVEVATNDEQAFPDAVVFSGAGGATPAVVRLVGGTAGTGRADVVVHASGRVEVSKDAAGPPAGRVDLDLD